MSGALCPHHGSHITDHASRGTHVSIDLNRRRRSRYFDVIEEEGYDVSVAGSGIEALKIYTTDPPDLMILDIWMPELDGLETLKRVKEFVPTAQVMMMSGH